MRYLTAVIIVLLLAGCDKDKDDPKPDLLIGTWIIDKYRITDLPSGFSAFEDYETNSLFGENSYILRIKADKTFERELKGDQNEIEDDGTWLRVEDKLELDIDDADDESFDIVNLSEDELTLSVEMTLTLLPDVVLDTLKQSTPYAVIEPYFQDVKAIVIHEFEK